MKAVPAKMLRGRDKRIIVRPVISPTNSDAGEAFHLDAYDGTSGCALSQQLKITFLRCFAETTLNQ